jgi:hypothetical protein
MAEYAKYYFTIENPIVEASLAWSMFQVVAMSDSDREPLFKRSNSKILDTRNGKLVRKWEISVWNKRQLSLIRHRIGHAFNVHSVLQLISPKCDCSVSLKYDKKLQIMVFKCRKCNFKELIWNFNDSN